MDPDVNYLYPVKKGFVNTLNGEILSCDCPNNDNLPITWLGSSHNTDYVNNIIKSMLSNGELVKNIQNCLSHILLRKPLILNLIYDGKPTKFTLTKLLKATFVNQYCIIPTLSLIKKCKMPFDTNYLFGICENYNKVPISSSIVENIVNSTKVVNYEGKYMEGPPVIIIESNEPVNIVSAQKFYCKVEHMYNMINLSEDLINEFFVWLVNKS